MKALICSILFVLLPVGHVNAQTLDDVTRSLVADIQQAKKQLERDQENIARQQSKLVDEVHEKVTALTALRAEAAAATRQQDDQLLDLKQLSDRLREWQSQSNYQLQVLLDLQQIISPSATNSSTDAFSAQTGLAQLNKYLLNQRDSLQPKVSSHAVVLPNGDVTDANTLKLGPVSWFYYADENLSGLLDSSESMASVSHVFSDEQHAQLASVFKGEPGMLTFDPTLEHLLKMARHQESFTDHLKKGGTWAIPILLFAGFALLIGLVKAATLIKLPALQPLFSERLSLIQNKGSTLSELKRFQSQTKEAQRELIDITLEHPVSQQRDDQLFAYLMSYRHKLEKGIGAIALVASISPLLGLLGTVSGMIETFRMMTLFGAGDPSAVSGGISEALVTTELGLIVAIPALILHALLNRNVKSRCITLEAQAIQLSQLELNAPVESSTATEQAA